MTAHLRYFDHLDEGLHLSPKVQRYSFHFLSMYSKKISPWGRGVLTLWPSPLFGLAATTDSTVTPLECTHRFFKIMSLTLGDLLYMYTLNGLGSVTGVLKMTVKS